MRCNIWNPTSRPASTGASASKPSTKAKRKTFCKHHHAFAKTQCMKLTATSWQATALLNAPWAASRRCGGGLCWNSMSPVTSVVARDARKQRKVTQSRPCQHSYQFLTHLMFGSTPISLAHWNPTAEKNMSSAWTMPSQKLQLWCLFLTKRLLRWLLTSSTTESTVLQLLSEFIPMVVKNSATSFRMTCGSCVTTNTPRQHQCIPSACPSAKFQQKN